MRLAVPILPIATLIALPCFLLFPGPLAAQTSLPTFSTRVLQLDSTAPQTSDELPLSPTPTVQPESPDTLMVFGRFDSPDLALSSLAEIGVSDGLGRPRPLIIETTTLTREFGEIVGMTLAFELDPASLQAGPPRIEWGPGVVRSNREVPLLAFPPDAVNRLRRFLPAPMDSPPQEETQLATIAIIADSRADIYFWWYLLPMAVVFGLLAVKKLWTP